MEAHRILAQNIAPIADAARPLRGIDEGLRTRRQTQRRSS